MDLSRSNRERPTREAIVSAVRQGLVGGATIMGSLVDPAVGTLFGTYAAIMAGAHQDYVAEKGRAAIEELLERVEARVRALEDEQSKVVTLEYFFSDQCLLEVRRIMEIVGRAQGQEKVTAAQNFAYHVATSQNPSDRKLRDFTEAFLRDCTPLEITVLEHLPQAGMYGSPMETSKTSNSILDIIWQTLMKNIGLGPDDELLVRGAVGRLYVIGLCQAFLGPGGSIMPFQRTKLGDEVLARITA